MEQLSLFSALSVKPPLVIAFIGGGGKTALMGILAQEMINLGHKVLLTTTTKIYPYPDLPHIYIDDSADIIKRLKKHFTLNNIAVLGKRPGFDHKITGIDKELIQVLYNSLDISILVEADGSRGKPLKGFADYEPVLPACADLVLPVIGADALGKTADSSTVHRLEQFHRIVGTSGIKPLLIDETVLAKTYNYMAHLGLIQSPQAKIIFILNKYDLISKPANTLNLAHLLIKNRGTRLLVTENDENDPVKINLPLQVNNIPVKVACIILAAGQSFRMGKDKLALPFKESTVLEETVKQILKSGFDDIIMVTRPGSHWEKVFANQNICIVENPDFRKGQASSVIAGLKEVDPAMQGVLFALGDQPLINSSIYKSLVQTYQSNLKPVTYPTHNGKRGNPVIFDRSLWPALVKLKDDQGGRAVINRLKADAFNPVETSEAAVLIDIDTPEDYEKNK